DYRILTAGESLMQALVLSTFFCAFAQIGDDKVFSGPQPGEKIAAFKAQAVYGVGAGKEIELAKDQGPTLLVFVHEITRPALQLLRPVDPFAFSLAKSGLATQFIFLPADKTKTEQYLTAAQKSLALQSPVSISLDGIEGPGSYGLNRKMTLTILLA